MPFPTRWTRRVAISINHLKIPSDSPNVTVKLTAANLPAEIFTLAQSTGQDIRATSDLAGTSRLPVDIVVFTPGGTPVAEIYVNVPSVSSSVDTVFYIWYGHPGPSAAAVPVNDTYGRNAVWAAVSALSVHHFQETSGTLVNAEGTTSRDGTGSNITYSADTGDGTKCIKCTAANNSKVTLGENVIPENAARSFEGWVYLASYGGSDRGRIISEQNGGTGHILACDGNSNNRLLFSGSSDLTSANNSFVLHQWVHVAFTYPSGTGSKAVKTYINGALAASATMDIDSGGLNTIFGARNTTDRNLDGWIDEFRVYSVVQSEDSIAISYNAQVEPATFATPGTPAILPGLPWQDTGTTFRQLDTAKILVSGVWKEVSEIKVLVSGVWKTVSD